MKKFFTAMATTTVVFVGAAGMSVSAQEHTVEKNDTLWNLSKEYNTSVQTIMNNNELDSNIIYPGQQLTIDEKKESNSNADTYKVKAGDTLSGISEAHGVSVSNLKTWNNLSSDLIIVGQKLAVKQNEEAVSEESVEEKQEEVVQAEQTEQEPKQESSSNGETITVTATAYTAKCEGCTGITSTGIDLNANPNEKVIAVDPNVIPLGTKVHVEGYGEAIAGDVGGAIKGDRIDIHVPTKQEANNWGVQTVNVKILD